MNLFYKYNYLDRLWMHPYLECVGECECVIDEIIIGDDERLWCHTLYGSLPCDSKLVVFHPQQVEVVLVNFYVENVGDSFSHREL